MLSAAAIVSQPNRIIYISERILSSNFGSYMRFAYVYTHIFIFILDNVTQSLKFSSY